MQDYKSLHVAIMICATLVNTQTASDQLYTIRSNSWANKITDTELT